MYLLGQTAPLKFEHEFCVCVLGGGGCIYLFRIFPVIHETFFFRIILFELASLILAVSIRANLLHKVVCFVLYYFFLEHARVSKPLYNPLVLTFAKDTQPNHPHTQPLLNPPNELHPATHT